MIPSAKCAHYVTEKPVETGGMILYTLASQYVNEPNKIIRDN